MITWSAVLLKGVPLFARLGLYFINKLIKKGELKDSLELQHLQTILDIYSGAGDSSAVSDACEDAKARLLAKKAEIDAKKAENDKPKPL